MKSHQKLIDELIRVDGIGQHLQGADHVICMSRVLDQACQQVGVASSNITVLGNRVSTTRFQPEIQHNHDPRIIRTLFIGRLIEQKNVHGICQALSLLKTQGWKVHLDVCGGKTMNDYLEEALSMLEPQDWHYWGSVPNRLMPKRFHEVDMYVGPSFFEGFQIPLIEALACGKPCVASSQPPASEIIDPATGILVNPEDPEDIAKGILQIKEHLNVSDQRLALTQRCRQEAVNNWSYKAISDQEVALYQSVMSNYQKRAAS